MGLTVTPCGGTLQLAAGDHVLTTARWERRRLLDRPTRPRVGHDGRTVHVAAGRVQVGSPAPAAPPVDVVRNGDTNVRAHVQGATKPFWLVLGESQSPGWHAHVVGGSDLGCVATRRRLRERCGWSRPHPGRSTSCSSGRAARQVVAAIWLSLLGAITVPRHHRFHVGPASLGHRDRPTHPSPETTTSVSVGRPGPRLRRRLALEFVDRAARFVDWSQPWRWRRGVGVLIAIVAFLRRDKNRNSVRLVMLVPSRASWRCALCTSVVQQSTGITTRRCFEWPTVFPRGPHPRVGRRW